MVPYSAGPLSAPSIGRAKQNPVLSTETLATNSAAEEDRKPLKYNNKSKPECSRKDGRRSFEVDKIPSMSNLSPLYGLSSRDGVMMTTQTQLMLVRLVERTVVWSPQRNILEQELDHESALLISGREGEEMKRNCSCGGEV